MRPCHALLAVLLLAAPAARAGCGASGPVSFLGNDFPAIQDVVAGAKGCDGDGVSVTANLNKDYEALEAAALAAKPAQYGAVHVTTSSVEPLLGRGLLRPLDDLVRAHGAELLPQQLITVNGKVVAIAFMANAQTLFYRRDVLDRLGLKPPATYAEVLEDAQRIRAAGVMENPFALNTRAGWNLGEEFVNMYVGEGGSFFRPGSAEPAINNPAGVRALTMLKELVAYSNPDYLTFDSNTTQALWAGGRLALATLWGSRAGAILGDGSAQPGVVANTVLAAAPTVGGGAIPATTLWWDGFAIAANASDAQAEAAFLVMLHAISPASVLAHPADAVWLVRGYRPSPAAAGVAATMAEGTAQPYPIGPTMGLMHAALGNALPRFFQGQEGAEQALADAEAAYRTAARAQGFLQ